MTPEPVHHLSHFVLKCFEMFSFVVMRTGAHRRHFDVATLNIIPPRSDVGNAMVDGPHSGKWLIARARKFLRAKIFTNKVISNYSLNLVSIV